MTSTRRGRFWIEKASLIIDLLPRCSSTYWHSFEPFVIVCNPIMRFALPILFALVLVAQQQQPFALAEEGAAVTKVIELQVPDEVLEERICGRWIHKKSGRSYHVKFAPPKSMKVDADGKPLADSMKDDETGEPLMQRPDDTATALVKRLKGYHGETVPILEHYRPSGVVAEVNANQGMEGVWKEVEASLARKSA